jgi:hypothetical protein
MDESKNNNKLITKGGQLAALEWGREGGDKKMEKGHVETESDGYFYCING